MASDAYTWWQALWIAVGAGLISSALGPLIAWLRDHLAESKVRQRDTLYLGQRLAVALEAFSIECATAIGDVDAWLNTNMQGGQHTTKLPQLPAFPQDADWRSLPSGISARVLSFPNEFKVSQAYIDGTAPFDSDAGAETFMRQAGAIGFRALRLAADIRILLRLPSMDHAYAPWSFEQTLQERSEAALKNDTSA